MDISTDWDKIVGHWLENVPYHWENGKEWKLCSRKYIILINSNETYERIKKDMLFFPDIKKCEDVKNFFGIYDYIKNKSNFESHNLRMNGKKVHIPIELRERYLTETNVIYLYNFLNIIHPIIEDWKRLIFEGKETLTPQIKFPKVQLEKTPRGKKGTILGHKNIYDMTLVFWYIHNAKKYKNVCIPVAQTPTIYYPAHFFISVIIYASTRGDHDAPPKNLELHNDYSPLLKSCMKSNKINKIILPVTWEYIQKFDKKVVSHQNIVIIDKKNKTKDGRLNIYVFDPHGSYHIHYIEDYVRELIKLLGLNNYNFKINHGMEICPKISFQLLEEKEKREGDYEGFCMAWSLWMIELFLLNEDFPYEKIVEKTLRVLPKTYPEFRRFIRRYAKFLENFGAEQTKKLGLEKDYFDIEKLKDVEFSIKLSWQDRRKLSEYVENLREEYLEMVK